MSAKQQPRGFVLIVIMVVAVAVLAGAIGISVVGGRASIASTYSSGGENARLIADTGLIRLERYANASSAANRDFDLALDPDRQANCQSIVTTGAVVVGATTFTPKFTDGSNVTYNGKTWRAIPYAGGAYLLRIDDNNDDNVTQASWSSFTGNTLGTNGGAPFCAEGPIAAAGHDNPARDRDRAVWLTSIGIYPGSDPATAKHRVVVRKMVINSAALAGAAFQTGGNIHGRIRLCTPIGSVAAVGSFDDLGTAAGCGCGTNTTPSGQFQNFGSCGACCNPGPGQTQVQAPVTAPTINPMTDASWFDWTSSCNLYMDPGLGLFFWDAARGALCNGYTGSVQPPSRDATVVGGCWTPLLTAALGFVPIPGIGTEVDLASQPGKALWNPNNAAVTYTADTLNGYYTTGTATGTKPDWSTCSNTATMDLRWNPPSADPGAGVQAVGCAGACNGTTPVLLFDPLGAADERFQFQNNRAAYPAAQFFNQGNFTNSQTLGLPNPPATSATSWAMFSLVVNGNFRNTGGTFGVGVGNRMNDFVSLAANGNVTVTAGELNVAGSVFSRGNIEGLGGTMNIHGVIRTTGNVLTSGAGTIAWDYTSDLIGAGAPTAPVPLTVTPTSF